MKRTLIAIATVTALLVLSGCSSDDDDDAPSSEAMGEGETSMPAPGSEAGDQQIDPEPSETDTSAIAGLWDAGTGAPEQRDERYVEISGNGLYTDYDFRDDAVADEGNCYIVTPLRLDQELPAEGDTPATYSIADGRSFTAERDGETLRVTFIADSSQLGVEVDDAPQAWPAVEGIVVSDQNVCEPEPVIEEEEDG